MKSTKAPLHFAGWLLLLLGLNLRGISATNLLYDAGGDKRVQSVKEAYASIDLGKDIKAARDTVEVLRQEQRAALNDYFASQRDKRLLDILNPGSSDPMEVRLFSWVNARLKIVLGDLKAPVPAHPWPELQKRMEQLHALSDAAMDIGDNSQWLEINRLRFAVRFGVTPPAYEGSGFTKAIGMDADGKDITPKSVLLAALGDRALEAADWLEQYEGKFEALDRAWEIVRLQAGNGMLEKDLAAIETEFTRSKQLQAAAKAAATKITEKEKAYKALAGPAGAPDKSKDKDDIAELQKQAKGLSDALADLPDVAKEKLLPERLADIDVILQAWASGKAPGKDDVPNEQVHRAAVLVSALPTFIQDANKIATGNHRPELVKLVFERARLNAELAAARKQNRSAEARISLYRQQVAASLRELQCYRRMAMSWRAIREEYCLTTDDDNAKELAVVFRDIKPRDPEKAGKEVLRCPGTASDVSPALRVNQIEEFNMVVAAALRAVRQEQFARAVAKQDLDFLQRQQGIDSAETALELWGTLLAEPINQLTAYYAAGIKPEDAAGLFTELVGLGAIAYRVK